MQAKVQILTDCPQCDGEAYLPAEMVTCDDGSPRLNYTPCPDCGGTGRQKLWIDLTDLLEMLAEHYVRDPMEPDWLALARQKPAGHLSASLEDAGLF